MSFQVGPCNGWLNNNATLRKLTTQRAVELSKVMSDIATSRRHFWRNLEINYIDCPITTGKPNIFNSMEKNGVMIQ